MQDVHKPDHIELGLSVCFSMLITFSMFFVCFVITFAAENKLIIKVLSQ